MSDATDRSAATVNAALDRGEPVLDAGEAFLQRVLEIEALYRDHAEEIEAVRVALEAMKIGEVVSFGNIEAERTTEGWRNPDNHRRFIMDTATRIAAIHVVEGRHNT